MKKLFIFLILGILLVGTLGFFILKKDTAQDTGDLKPTSEIVVTAQGKIIKEYSPSKKIITLKDIETKSEILSARLDTPHHNIVFPSDDTLFAEITLNSKQDYNDIIKGIEFYNLNNEGQIEDKPFNIKYSSAKLIDVPDISCNPSILGNGSEEIRCVNLDTTHKEIKTEWLAFDNKIDKDEVVTLGFFTSVKEGDYYEFIPNIAEVKIKEWATFGTATRYEWYSTGDDDFYGISSALYHRGQTFTVGTTGTNEDFDIVGIRFLLYRTGSPGNIYTVIRAVDGDGKPTGPILSSGSFNGNDLTTNTAGEWTNITMSDYALEASTSYYVGIDGNNTDGSNKVNIRNDISSPSYTGGNATYSNDDGGTWTIVTATDVLFEVWGEQEIVITLLSPEDEAILTNNINFSANVSDPSLIGIQNVTLGIIYSNGTLFYNETNTSGFEGVYNWTDVNIPDGNWNWSVDAYNDYNKSYESEMRVFLVDTIYPTVNILSLEGGIYHKSGNNLTLNWMVVDLNLDTCWFNYNFTNTTVTCADNITTFALTFQKNLTFYVNDTFGHLSSDFTTWFYHSWEYERTFNNITYETASETYNIKINTIDSITPTNPRFFYDDVEYLATVTPLGGNNFSISKTSDALTISSEVNKTFYFQWNIDVALSTSETSNQTIKTISFIKCFVGTSYLNFTFKDEGDDSTLNASNDLTDVDYWLGGGSETKSYITSNNTEHHDYTFCFSPSDRTVIVDLIFKYSKTGYPLRTFTYDDQSLTNTTLNKTLYLLSTTDGIYSSISVIESSGASIEGVVIQIERQFGGVWTLISQDTTGSDGVATFWVNPNFQHRITATKTNYVTTQVTITPSQTLYTLTMQRTTTEAEYDSDILGIKWVAYPLSGTIPPGIRSFNVTVTSSESNLENCKFELVNVTNSSHVLDSVISITNSSYCFLNIDYNAQENSKFFGRLSLDTTETTGYIIVNADWKWIVIEIDVKGWRTITSFFADLTTLSEFGEGNEAEFSRIVTFFLIATIIFGVFIYFSGVELNSPGITILLIWGITLFASAGGFLTFYSGSSNVNPIIEQYGFFFIFTIYMINYFMTIIRRANE